jgi:hypothetical protein
LTTAGNTRLTTLEYPWRAPLSGATVFDAPLAAGLAPAAQTRSARRPIKPATEIATAKETAANQRRFREMFALIRNLQRKSIEALGKSRRKALFSQAAAGSASTSKYA